MRIHVIYTGGTIGMVSTDVGLAPGFDIEGRLAGLDGAASAEMSFSALDPLIDSSNATPESWQAIIDELWARRSTADAFLVLHGTDTMAYTAAALSYALGEFDKPVVLTGSQIPAQRSGSDAASNVNGALAALQEGPAFPVSLYFGGKLLPGTRVTKISAWALDAYSAPNGVASCVSEQSGAQGWKESQPYDIHDVAVITLTPGITVDRVRSMLSPLPEAVIVRAYGVGNMPSHNSELIDVFAQAIKDGVPVIVSSQCQQASVRLSEYEAGNALARAGAVGAGDMLFEALYAKVLFLLSQGIQGSKLAQRIGQPIAGEISI